MQVNASLFFQRSEETGRPVSSLFLFTRNFLCYTVILLAGSLLIANLKLIKEFFQNI